MRIGIVTLHKKTRLGAWSDRGYAARSILSPIPGARWSAQDRCWTFPMAFASIMNLSVAAETLAEPIFPDPDAAEWAQLEAAAWQGLTVEAQTVATEGTEGFFGHQVQCARWLSLPGANGGRLDTSETGSGKTRSVLRAAWNCWNNGERGILLVSTLVTVKYGWRTEVANVALSLPLPDDREWQVFSLPNGMTVDKRRKVIAAAREASEAAGGVGVVLLVNHEQLRSHSRLSAFGDIALRRCPKCNGPREGEGVVKEAQCEAHAKELNELDYVAVVYDECHRMMTPSAKTTRAAWAVTDCAPRVWGLTGTPGSRDVMSNTWSLQRLVYGSDWPSKSSWTEYYAHAGHNSLGVWEVGELRTEHEREFRVVHNAIARRVLKEQVLDLPPLLRGGTLERYVSLPKGDQRQAYFSMRDHLWMQVEEGTITAQNMLVQRSRLTMLANATGIPGPDYGKLIRIEYDKDGNEKPIYNAEMKLRMPSVKVDALVDMALGGDFDGVQVVFQFVHPELVEMTRQAFVEKKVIRLAEQFGMIIGGVPEQVRAATIERFQAGRLPFIGFTTQAGGAGITLTASPLMVAVERPWSPIQWRQAQDRVHRIGSQIHDSVTIIDLITEDTVEEDQIERWHENENALEEVVLDKERVRAMLFRGEKEKG